MNYLIFDDKCVLHPGYYIGKYLQHKSIGREKFADIILLSNEDLTAILNGDADLTLNVALRIAKAVGTSVALWMNIQAEWNAAKDSYRNAKEDVRADKIKWADSTWLIENVYGEVKKELGK